MADKETIQVPGLKTIEPYSQAVRGRHSRTLRRFCVREAAGADLVANASILVTGIANFGELNCLFAKFFPANPPPAW